MPHATSAVHLSILLLLLLLLLPFLMLYLPSTDCFFRQHLEVLVIVVQLDSMQPCKALGAFMASSSPGAFSGTALDYTLDQLFIHLDDPDAEMQAVVYDVIIIGSSLNVIYCS